MVIDKKLNPLHPLTELGREHYQQMLERAADEIIFKHKHPLKWIFLKAKEAFE